MKKLKKIILFNFWTIKLNKLNKSEQREYQISENKKLTLILSFNSTYV